MASRPGAIETPFPITSERRLAWFVWNAFGVAIPNVPVCPGHSTPWRAFADAYFARTPVVIWKASRGFGGKSNLLSTLSAAEAISLSAGVNVLGGSGEQSKRVIETLGRFWVRPEVSRYVSSKAQHITRFTNGAKVTALKASQTSVRGPHEPRLRLDEIDEMDQDILDAALGQPMSSNGVLPNTVCSSTHQHPAGTMTEMLRRAEINRWAVHTWCYRESMAGSAGWLAEAEVEAKRNSIPESMWLAEYECQEPTPEGRAFNTKAIDEMFDKELGSFKGMPGEVIETQGPIRGALYATGADWARKKDRTIIVTVRFDVVPARIVAFEAMHRVDWPFQISRYEARLKRFPGSAAFDETGIGDVVRGVSGRGTGIMLVGRTRSDLLTEYVTGVERGQYRAPRISLAYDEHRYASVDDLYGQGHLPDTVCAMALAHRASLGRMQPAWATA